MAGVLFRYYAACCMILIEITTQITSRERKCPTGLRSERWLFDVAAV